METHIVVGEPQFEGFQHVPFNAALLWTGLLAWPGASVTFLATAEQCALVSAALRARAPGLLARVTFDPRPAPTTKHSGLRRVAEEAGWWRMADQVCFEKRAGLLLLCSVTGCGIIARSMPGIRGGARTPTLAVLHSGTQCLRPPLHALLAKRTLFGLRYALRLPQPGGLRYLVLGEPILGQLREAVPWAADRMAAMDHPGLWDIAAAEPRADRLRRPVRFGFVGHGGRNRGFGTFCRLALAQREAVAAGQSEFVLAGFVVERECAGLPGSELLVGAGFEPLPGHELAARLRSLDYVVWTGEASHYRLTASGTFVDALGHAKPCIARRALYVDHCFERMGDIGYLCDGEAEMSDAIAGIVANFPEERYRQQCANILRGRIIFEPATLAPRLREIAAGIRSGN